MKNYFKNYPLAKTGFFVIPLVVFTIVMGIFFPESAPEHFSSFIIAFEFAQSPDDINLLLSPLSAKEIRQVDVGNYLDFGFMIVYTALLIKAFEKCAQLLDKKILKTGIFIAIVVLISDVAENIFLLRLTSNHINQSLNSEIMSNLDYLKIFTWTKWISLSVLFTFFYALVYNLRWLFKIIGVIFLFPLLYLIAAPEQSPEMLSNFTNSIFLCFFTLIIFLFLYRKKA
ncbi:hypothetical protein GM418_26415 [Maribellus comscasis]|uniref:Uncharacterized protein n=1 Tax=Maribellus comscasis TaxID=2681766 RepID=A0A6I6JVD6_9BACT|nr:hypothetical protein [Maribellus comscasis]QGY47066.1 hypothetical protein GM418_26415 [Maribellus comscasis]